MAKKIAREKVKKPVDWALAQRRAATTARWAVIMTKVRIRRVLSRTRWQLITFCGKSGGESVGVVDLLAIRKDHAKPSKGLKRGDALQLILIQVKGGSAAMPTRDDAHRLRRVARIHRARHILLAAWKRGTAARFFQLESTGSWKVVEDVDAVFQ